MIAVQRRGSLHTDGKRGSVAVPVPCGWYGDPLKALRKCFCSLAMVSHYQKRISGLLLNLLDTLHGIQIAQVEYDKLL